MDSLQVFFSRHFHLHPHGFLPWLWMKMLSCRGHVMHRILCSTQQTPGAEDEDGQG